MVATELGKELAKRGHEIHFMTSSLPVRLRQFDSNIHFHEVRPEHYPVFLYPPYSLSLAAKMAEVAETFDLDVLHTHYAMPHAAAAYLANQMLRDRAIRTVTTLHGTDITLVGQAPSFYKVTRFSIEESHAVTAVSDWLKGETERIFKTERPIHVIPNFVDTELFKPREIKDQRACFANTGEKIVLHVSNFRPVKNVETVIRVFAQVADNHPSRLLMVGDGPDRIPAERLAKQLGVQDKVTFLGGQEYVEDLMPCADVFLLPSLHESFGLVALEAMSVGVPVIGSSVGGTSEVVVDGESGFLRDPLDVEGLAGALNRVLADDRLAQAMGEAGRGRAESRFHMDRIVPMYLDVYQAD